MRSSSLLVLMLVASAALAGCTGGGNGVTDDDDLQVPPPRAGTGLVVGVVVDSTITPVADATVVILNTELETQSDSEGRFVFRDVEPGAHQLRVSKPGFTTVQQGVQVEANVADPPIVRVLVEADPESRPYVFETVFTGFIECSATAVAVGVAVCSVVDLAAEEAGQPPVTNDEFLTLVEVDMVPTFIQSELVWQSTQDLGDELDLLYSWDCGGTFLCDHRAGGTSPVMIQANATVIEEMGVSQEQPLMIRVFNKDLESTKPPCVDGVVCPFGVGVTLSQEFQVFTHVFYNQLPEDGWRFTADGSPPNTV